MKKSKTSLILLFLILGVDVLPASEKAKESLCKDQEYEKCMENKPIKVSEMENLKYLNEYRDRRKGLVEKGTCFLNFDEQEKLFESIPAVNKHGCCDVEQGDFIAYSDGHSEPCTAEYEKNLKHY